MNLLDYDKAEYYLPKFLEFRKGQSMSLDNMIGLLYLQTGRKELIGKYV